MRLILAVAVLIVTAVSGVRAQDVATPGVVTYYLHQTGKCEGAGNTEEFSDQKDTTGDLDGCGGIAADQATGGASLKYEGREPLANASLDGTSTATGFIYVTTDTPDTVSVDVGIVAGPASCTGTSETQTVTNTLVGADFALFEIACTFNGVATPAAVPTITVLVHSQALYFMGYEDDHASRIEIHGKPVMAANNSSAPAPTSGKDTPGLGPAIVLAFVATVAIVARRRE